MRAPQLTIRRSSDRRNLALLRKLRQDLYRNDADWIPPLASQVKRAYSNSHPYLRKGQIELFVALLGNEPVAAATAFFDADSAKADAGVRGYFCGFETVNDAKVAAAVLEAAESWVRGFGATEIMGPMSPRLSDARGTLIVGGGAPVFGMAYTPYYYNDLLSAVGFSKATDLYEFAVTCRGHYPRLEKVAAMARRRFPSLHVRAFDMGQLRREFNLVAEIYNAAWRNNWGFMPLDVEDLVYSVSGLVKMLGPACAVFVEIDGVAVGFQMVVPNLNTAIKAVNGRLWPFGWRKMKSMIASEKVFRALFIGVVPRFRKSGVEAVLIQSALETGAEQFHIGWVLESNFAWKSEIENLTEGDLAFKKYRIYRKSLQEGPVGEE